MLRAPFIRRLVQAKKFDELEEALNQAALKVEAVRRVTFVSPVPSNPSSSASTSSPHPSNTTPTHAQNQPQPLAPKRLKSIAEKSVFSKATTASEGGYNPETTSSYDGTYKTRETTPRRRLSGLNKAGLWWKNATSGTRPQRPPVGVTRAVRSSPVPSVRSGSGHSSSGTNPRRAGMSGSASASEGYVTAPEYRSGSASETEGGYHTAQEVMYTSGTERYYTAEEGEEDD
ncbi:hypothetical protein BCR33DRAFT_713362 [Rhizoclosmatium globosum]|uniref:Uncharacterized protein n=1 Tax=Rhizoclosmatium globosum TaxID=329046 RepID=A0A1Y2CRT6_9FUNG|nr:hypothetical protein BCR33DRAFT_713362 [Rhizoclosmatium globosum]|eukprot:ORY49748.1 hypothetical protein BCR33DRAFT_713362 [Rhizoclosmatium globosum]